MLVIGVTGGIGSGKSTVCEILSQLGAVVVDADQISRKLTQPGGLAMSQIVAEFGEQAMAEDGSMNRPFMRQLVFNDAAAKQRLESILHPLISTLSLQQEAQARAALVRLLVHDVPLLVESFSSWRDRLDSIWVVDCAVETQIQRVMTRSGLSRTEVASIIAQQASREQRLAIADEVIDNDSKTLSDLRSDVQAALKRLGL